MAIFTPKQIRLFGDQRLSGELVGHGNKALNQLKAYMDAAGLPIGGPHFIRGDGFTIMVKSVPGIRDFIDVYTTTGGGIEREATPPAALTRLLLFWGSGEEKIDFEYDEGSALFLPGEITCGNGSGTVAHVAGNSLYGEFVRCWDNGEEIFSDIASGTIRGCETQHYWRLYTTREIFSSFRLEPHENTMSPVDELHRDCHDNIGDQVFSKTLGPVTVSAFEIEGSTPSDLLWGLAAKYNGRPILFDGAKAFYDGAFIRQKWVFQGAYYTVEKLDALFDVWITPDGETMIGACSQQEMFVWRIDGATATMVVRMRLDGLQYDGSPPLNYSPTVVGYYEWYAIINNEDYFTIEQAAYPQAEFPKPDLKRFHLPDNASGGIIKTLWHQVKNKLYFIYDEKDSVGDDYGYLEIIPGTHIVTKHQLQIYICTYTPELELISSEGYDQDCTVNPPSSGTRTVTQSQGGVEYSISFQVYYGIIGYVSYDIFWNTYADIRLWEQYDVAHGALVMGSLDAFTINRALQRFDRGRTVHRSSNGYSRYDQDSWLSGAYDPAEECTSSYRDYSLTKWTFTPDDIAYHIAVLPPPQEYDDCLKDSTIRDDCFQNSSYLNFDEWEAILKGGVDRDGQNVVAPAVCYHDPDGPNIFFATGEIPPRLLGPGDRAFFQQVEIIDEQGIEEDTP